MKQGPRKEKESVPASKPYTQKYNKEGTSPKVRVDLLLNRTLYQRLVQQKKEEGISIGFFIERVIEKAFKEKEKHK